GAAAMLQWSRRLASTETLAPPPAGVVPAAASMEPSTRVDGDELPNNGTAVGDGASMGPSTPGDGDAITKPALAAVIPPSREPSTRVGATPTGRPAPAPSGQLKWSRRLASTET